MSQMIDSTITVVSAAETITNNTAATFAQEIDLRGAIGGVLQVELQYSVAPTADKTLDLYLLARPGGGAGDVYDDYSQGRNIALGSIKVGAVTTLQRLSTVLDPANLCVPYGKLAIHNNATGQTVTVSKLVVSVRKVG